MKRIKLASCWAFWAICAFCCWMLAESAAMAAEPVDGGRLRELFVEDVAENDGASLAPTLHLTKPITHSAAFQYRILLWKGEDKPEPVDPRTYKFQLGHRIRIEVQPVKDSYIHILTKGPSGRVKCLWPKLGDKPPLVRANEKVALPNGSGVIVFGRPVGTEEVIVIASDQPIEDLLRLADPGVSTDHYHSALAKLDLIRGLPGLAFRGLEEDDWKEFQGFVEQVARDQPDRVKIEMPADKEGDIAVVEVSTSKAPNLYVTIPLESTESP